MDSQKLLTKRNIIGLIIALILLISLPLGIFLAQQTQIFKPRATSLPANLVFTNFPANGLTNNQSAGTINFDFTTVPNKKVGVSFWRGLNSPGEKRCDSKTTCPAGTFEHFETDGSDGSSINKTGWGAWVIGENEKVPFLLEYSNGEVDFQRTFEAIKPTAIVKVLDGSTPVTDLNSLSPIKDYTIKIEATDNGAAEAGKRLMAGATICNTAIGNIQISAASGRADKNGEWINADSGRCPENGSFTYTRTIKAPFYLEYSVADINKNLTTGSLTGNLASSGGQSSNTTTALDCYIDATGFTKDDTGYFVKTVTVNTPINFSARYNWPAGTAASKQTGDLMVVNVPDGGGGNCWKTGGTSDCSNPPALTSNHQSINWTPTVAGTYSVMCRSVVPNVAECRGDNRFSSGVSVCPNEQNEKSGHVTVTVTNPVSNTADCTVTGGPSSGTMKVGESATYTASYSSTGGPGPFGEINIFSAGKTGLYDNHGMIAPVTGQTSGSRYMDVNGDNDFTAADRRTTSSIKFSPTTAETYTVTCRTSNGNDKECYPPGNKASSGGNVACSTASVKTVTVQPQGIVDPSPSPSPAASSQSSNQPSSSPVASASPSPSPAVSVISLGFDATGVPYAVQGVDITLPIKMNTAISTNIYDVTVLDITLKYNNEDFDYVDLVVAPNIGFNTRCSDTGAGTGANICKLKHIRSNVGVGPTAGTIQLVTSTPIGVVVSGDPIIANLKLRGKKVTPKSSIEFIKDKVTAVGITPGVILGVETRDLDLAIRERVFTTTYKVCEANGNIEDTTIPASAHCYGVEKPYKNFGTTGKVMVTLENSNEKGYKFYDQTPGPKTIFVEFTSSDGRKVTEKTLINYLPNPSITGPDSGITCNFVGEGMEALIYGTNFYAKGSGSGIKINGQQAEIIEWKENVPPPGTLPVTPIVTGIGSTASIGTGLTAQATATSPSPALSSSTGITPKLWLARAKIARSSKDLVPVELTTVNGTKVTGSCQVGATTVDITIQSKCGPQPTTIKDDVDITFYENTTNVTPIGKAKAKVDSKGKPLAFTPPTLQQSRDYVVIVKSPKTLARKIDFKTQTGTSILETIDLPTGNIAPAANPDSKINSLDRSELVKQWSLTSDVVKTGDFNEDGRINSIDWSCMRENFNKDDETFTGTR